MPAMLPILVVLISHDHDQPIVVRCRSGHLLAHQILDD
jgi:hypothetical protein